MAKKVTKIEVEYTDEEVQVELGTTLVLAIIQICKRYPNTRYTFKTERVNEA